MARKKARGRVKWGVKGASWADHATVPTARLQPGKGRRPPEWRPQAERTQGPEAGMGSGRESGPQQKERRN